jgi:hypothetical protein
MHFRNSIHLAWLTITLVLAAAPSSATPILNASVSAAPTGPFYANFDNLALGNAGGQTNNDIHVSFTGDAQIVTGFLSGYYAAPYVDGNGGLFADSETGSDTTHYLSTGIGSVTLTFTKPQTYLGLLWGSVDLYNHLSFYGADNQLVATVGGAEVSNAANGDQGASGSYYVNISGLDPFTTAVFSSDGYAFEFDNVSYDVDPPAAVPEPLTLSIFGTGLASIARMRRRKAKLA